MDSSLVQHESRSNDVPLGGMASPRWPARARILTTLAIVLALLVIIGVAGWLTIQALIDSTRSVTRTYRVIAELDRLSESLVDQETGQRGFLLTGDERYLEPYQAAATAADAAVAQLKDLTADRPEQQRRVAALLPLIADKRAEMERTIALRRAGGLAAALPTVQTDRGKRTMDAIRAGVAEIAGEEQRLLAERQQAVTFQTNVVALIAGGSIALIAALAILQAAIALRSLGAVQRAGEAARASEQRFRGLFEGVGDAVLVSDAEGRLLDVNPALSALTGYAREEVQRLRVGELMLVHDPTWLEEHAREVLEAGSWQGEFEVRARDGRVIPVEARVTVQGRPRRPVFIAVWRDISERRARARQEQELLAVITHDLKTPLTGISGQAQLMLRRKAFNERALESITAQAQRLARLVDDLLDASRLGAGRLELRLERVDLTELARAAVEQARAVAPAHTPRLDASEEPVIALGDRDRLGQVVQNLLSNAVKYSPAGGEVRVRVERVGREGRVSVRDQGIGIAPEALPRLFERFYRAPEAATSPIEGIGLGLYICRGLVEAHGGRLWVESTPGAGSTFTFSVPLAEPDAGTALGAPNDLRLDGNGGR